MGKNLKSQGQSRHSLQLLLSQVDGLTGRLMLPRSKFRIPMAELLVWMYGHVDFLAHEIKREYSLVSLRFNGLWLLNIMNIGRAIAILEYKGERTVR